MRWIAMGVLALAMTGCAMTGIGQADVDEARQGVALAREVRDRAAAELAATRAELEARPDDDIGNTELIESIAALEALLANADSVLDRAESIEAKALIAWDEQGLKPEEGGALIAAALAAIPGMGSIAVAAGAAATPLIALWRRAAKRRDEAEAQADELAVETAEQYTALAEIVTALEQVKAKDKSAWERAIKPAIVANETKTTGSIVDAIRRDVKAAGGKA